MHMHGSSPRRRHSPPVRYLLAAGALLLAVGFGPAVVPAHAATVLSQSWETGLKSEVPAATENDLLTGQPNQWLVFSGGFPVVGGSQPHEEGGQGTPDTNQVGNDGIPGWPAAVEFFGDGGLPTTDVPASDRHNLWHVQEDPQSVEINAFVKNLISLPETDQGKLPEPPQGSGKNVAWFGDVSTGTYCGPLNDVEENAKNKTEPKNGCETPEDKAEEPAGGATQPVQEGELVSPPFSLKNAERAELQFESWFEIGAKEATKLDIMEIDYTTNEGTTGDPFHWQILESLKGVEGSSPTATPDKNYTDEGEEKQASWRLLKVDLKDALHSEHVRLRFVFDTWNAQSNGFRGWLIDNVNVVAQEPTPPPPPTEPPVVTTTSPPPKQPPPTPAPAPTPTPVPATKPPFAKLIIIYEKSGEIETEYDFPEGGIAEEGAEVLQGASIARVHAGLLSPLGGALATAAAKSKKCKQGFVRKGTRCVSNKPVTYGRTRMTVPKAGHYNLRIKPSKRIMTALKSGKRLKVQLTLVFTPAGTTHHIRVVHNVAVQMKHRPKKK
ncbi:MAG: hypothetical protein QOI89_2302 [Solirubrobacteraceae bacterium]|jgi:hypothetical protein|nr:hypothetical protein [Solirubrobacteraceae bacterium]